MCGGVESPVTHLAWPVMVHTLVVSFAQGLGILAGLIWAFGSVLLSGVGSFAAEEGQVQVWGMSPRSWRSGI